MICSTCHHAHRPGRDCLDAERQRIGACQLRARQPPRDTRRAIRQGLRDAFAADISEMAAAARQPAADGPTTEGSALVTGACDVGFGGQVFTKVWLDESHGGAVPVIVTETRQPSMPPEAIWWRGLVMHKSDVAAIEEQERLAARALLDTSAAHLLDQDPQP